MSKAREFYQNKHLQSTMVRRLSLDLTDESTETMCSLMQAFHEDQLTKKLEAVTDEEARKRTFEYDGLQDRTMLRWPIPSNAPKNKGFYDGWNAAIEHLKPKK